VITNSGVVITETDIQAPLPNGSRIVIDLVCLDSLDCSNVEVDPETTEQSEPGALPTLILLTLSALLAHAHHVNLKKRQGIPEPLSIK
jgi:hypothetical protein